MNLSKTPKVKSLKSKDEIKDLFSTAKRVRTPYGIIFLKKDSSGENLAAVLIKKSTGNAVHRNYCKRIVRHFIHKHAEKLLVYNKIIFLYLYNGKIGFEKLESGYLKALEKYEQNSFSNH